jgi:hypothetical protein
MFGPIPRPILDRFLEKISMNGGCWIWMGSKCNRGYGGIAMKKKNGWSPKRTHRLSWEIFYGNIPKGLCVCHKCDTPSCVSPYHLFLGTVKDNQQDMISKNRKNNYNIHKIHCKRGHLLEGNNLKIKKRNGKISRHCIPCEKMTRHFLYLKQKEKK